MKERSCKECAFNGLCEGYVEAAECEFFETEGERKIRIEKYETIEKEKILCTKKEFEALLGKEYRIVSIRRSAESEFLFDAEDTESQYVCLNLLFGLDNRSFSKCLDRNESSFDVLELIRCEDEM